MISVCMATYNGEKVVVRQLTSILSQLSVDDEIVIIDDCSTDQTIAMINKQNDPRITVVKNDVNRGPIKSFEKALTIAQGDILFLSDQDDVWLAEKVSTMLKIFAETEASIVVHDSLVVDGELVTLAESWNQHNHNKLSPTLVSTVIKNGFSGCMMALKKEVAQAALPFPTTIEMHDQWLALTALKNQQKIVMIDKKLMLFVRHGANVTSITKRPLGEQLIGRFNTIRAILNYKKLK